jgi:hypothetical protein
MEILNMVDCQSVRGCVSSCQLVANRTVELPTKLRILHWFAYARSSAPGYMETWAPEEIDLIATLGDYEDDEHER